MNRVLIRTVALVAITGVLAGVVIWLKSRRQDRLLIDLPTVSSGGYILALKQTDAGDRLVSISADGATIREASGPAEVVDKDPVWKPDGRRAIFVSNRTEDGSYQIFEWKPDRDNKPFQITANGAARQNPWFSPDGRDILYASQGDVLATGYEDLHTRRVMPPGEDPNAGHEEGEPESGQHQHDIISEAWLRVAPALEGEAFAKGFVTRDGKHFVGIYTTARGQALILQNLDPAEPKDAVAKVPLAGDSIEVSFDGAHSVALVTVVNFRYPVLDAVPKEKINADGTVSRDFVNAAFLVDMTTGTLSPVFLSPDGKNAVVHPCFSPDGTVVAGVFQEKLGDSLVSRALVIFPAERAGIGSARPASQGNVSSPSWSPDGERLAFVRDGDIWTVKSDGGNEKNITNGRGKFRSPLYSPMR